MDLIVGFMENYLALSAKEELAFQQAVDRMGNNKEKQSVMELMTSWERKGRQEGRLAIVKRLQVLTGKLSPSLERDVARLAEALLDFSSTRDLERWLQEHRS